MFQRTPSRHPLASPVLSGIIGLVAGFAVCVFLVRSQAHDTDLRFVTDASAGVQADSKVVSATDIEGHTLTVEDLLRCHHALIGKAFPDPFPPGIAVATGDPRVFRSPEIVAETKYSDDDLRLCVNTLNSLAGLGTKA